MRILSASWYVKKDLNSLNSGLCGDFGRKITEVFRVRRGFRCLLVNCIEFLYEITGGKIVFSHMRLNSTLCRYGIFDRSRTQSFLLSLKREKKSSLTSPTFQYKRKATCFV